MDRFFLRLILLAVLLMHAPDAGARPPRPVDVPALDQIVPDDANLALKGDLDRRYADLLQRYYDYDKQADAYDAKYQGVSEDSPDYAPGQAILSQLVQLNNDYKRDAAAFADDVAKLRLRPAGAPVNPVFDSRKLITADEYNDALQKQKELLVQQQRWQKELAKLRRWQQGLQSDADEFAKIQSAAQIDYLHDVLMNLPAGETFEELAGLKYLTREQAGALTAGFDALKGLVSGAEGISGENHAEQLDNILGAQKNLRDAMLDQTMAGLKESNPQAWQYLDSYGKTLDAAKEMLVYSQQADYSDKAKIKTAVKLAAVAVPFVNYGVILETAGEKKLTQHIVQAPLDSLNNAMSQNFNAQRYLGAKLDSVNYALAGVQETIQNYRAVHPQSR